MLSNKTLESLECALSNHLKHISINPLNLSCGHTACKECISNNKSGYVTCIHCKLEQEAPNTAYESLPAKTLFNVFIDKMFNYIEDKFKSSLKSLKESCFEENLALKIELLKNDIDVRIESLKYDLDSLRENLFEQLNNIKTKIIEEKFKNQIPSATIEHFETNYRDLINYNVKVLNKTEEDFKKYQHQLKKLYAANENILKNDFELKFVPSNVSIKETLIGQIDYSALWKVDTNIIKMSEIKELIELCEFKKNYKWSLLYRGSRDGFRAKDFHLKCDGKSPTLTVIKTNDGYIFGGYTQAEWDSSNNVVFDSNAFIFSFKNEMDTQFKSKVVSPKCAIVCGSRFGPCFGGCYNLLDYGYGNDAYGSSDIFIADNSNVSSNSSTSFPKRYSSNDYLTKYCLNGGLPKFNVTEIEVFKID